MHESLKPQQQKIIHDEGENIMGEYIVLWEADESKIPLDAKER